jgi:hypothetical protein
MVAQCTIMLALLFSSNVAAWSMFTPFQVQLLGRGGGVLLNLNAAGDGGDEPEDFEGMEKSRIGLDDLIQSGAEKITRFESGASDYHLRGLHKRQFASERLLEPDLAEAKEGSSSRDQDPLLKNRRLPNVGKGVVTVGRGATKIASRAASVAAAAVGGRIGRIGAPPEVAPQPAEGDFYSPANPLVGKWAAVASSREWRKLSLHKEHIASLHLRALLSDPERCAALKAETEDGIVLDYSRQQVTLGTMKLLLSLARRQGVEEKVAAMFEGQLLNPTEKRPVLHTATRALAEDGPIMVDGVDVVSLVHTEQRRIEAFTNAVRAGSALVGHGDDDEDEDEDEETGYDADEEEELGKTAEGDEDEDEAARSLTNENDDDGDGGGDASSEHPEVILGFTGRPIKNIVSVGIGGSYLGPEFVSEVLATEGEGIFSSQGFTLRFLANVDPVDVQRAVSDLDPEETLVLVVSKTFTTVCDDDDKHHTTTHP